MSTTFEIYPSDASIPMFMDVLDACTKQFHLYLEKVGINRKPEIEARLLTCKDNFEIAVNPYEPFSWDENQYLWVAVKGVVGGTDGYFWLNDQHDFEYWIEDIIQRESSSDKKDILVSCINQGHHWSFRRSAGQPGVVNILYGLLAGTLACLTNGVVFSDDSAWDFNRMPITGKEFLDSYFIPEKELNTEVRDWAIRCINNAKDELEEINA